MARKICSWFLHCHKSHWEELKETCHSWMVTWDFLFYDLCENFCPSGLETRNIIFNKVQPFGLSTHHQKRVQWASLVAQWLRVCLPMQGTRVHAPVREDPTCRGATKPVSHNYWACASGACAPQQERPRWWEARVPQWRVAPACHN